MKKVLLLPALLCVILAGCATTAAVPPTSPDDVRCTREPTGTWNPDVGPYGGLHQHIEDGRPTRMSVLVDITPIEKHGGHGFLIAIDSSDQFGTLQRNYIFLPSPNEPDYRPLDRIVRCLKGAIERRYEEWKTFFGFSYPSPAAKPKGKGGGR